MLVVKCPVCGAEGDETDFHAGGQAHVRRHRKMGKHRTVITEAVAAETAMAPVLEALVKRLILASESAIKRFGLVPLARFVSYASRGVPPHIMGIGPVEAIPLALKRAGLKQDDLDWIELNEAFAAQSLAVMNTLGLDPARVNPMGGAIALGSCAKSRRTWLSPRPRARCLKRLIENRSNT